MPFDYKHLIISFLVNLKHLEISQADEIFSTEHKMNKLEAPTAQVSTLMQSSSKSPNPSPDPDIDDASSKRQATR